MDVEKNLHSAMSGVSNGLVGERLEEAAALVAVRLLVRRAKGGGDETC